MLCYYLSKRNFRRNNKVDKKQEVDVCYGLKKFYITKEEIAALLSGKKLYSTVNCDEYAITIEMEETNG